MDLDGYRKAVESDAGVTIFRPPQLQFFAFKNCGLNVAQNRPVGGGQRGAEWIYFRHFVPPRETILPLRTHGGMGPFTQSGTRSHVRRVPSNACRKASASLDSISFSKCSLAAKRGFPSFLGINGLSRENEARNGPKPSLESCSSAFAAG